MSFQLPPLEEIANEADVESKLIYPLLTAEEPYGLGLKSSAIHGKMSIKRFVIGKGSDQKLYYPDFLIVVDGFPIVAIEAKTPDEDVLTGFREARLYAAELNALYPSGINPLTRVVATNGKRWVAGPHDHNVPQLDFDYTDINPYSEKMHAFYGLVGQEILVGEALRLARVVHPDKLWRPRQLLGGIAVQNEELGHNTFGATIAGEFSHIFNPSSLEDRQYIVKEGYIPSRRRERYIDPIDQVIRASKPPSSVEARRVEDTSDPKEVISTLRSTKPLEHQVLLIVGGVGAGKSTFIDYVQYVALPEDIISSTIWVRVNMNVAPLSPNEIYDFLRREIITGCRTAYKDIDFDELDVIKAVFAVEVNQFNKGVGKLYVDTELYKQKLAEELAKLDDNLHQKAIAYTRYCATERRKLLILVLDNCDKRLLNEQLMMFDAANWVQKEFRALVILPLREETYNNYRDKPPLDTALKDLVFQIEPPIFHNILARRVQLALNEISRSSPKTFRFDLPNGFHVEYAACEQAYYLTSIIRAIFEYDKQIRRMIVGLAARNMRRALEIFLEFCTSGHIGEDQILKIRKAQGDYLLPMYIVVRVLLRMNCRFYDSDFSYVKNLLAANSKDLPINHFSRLMILRWLYDRFSDAGPTGLKGYFPIRHLMHELSPYGVGEKVVIRELEYLARAQCIISEDFRVDALTENDLIKLAPAGFVHLEMLQNVNYLAAVAEDTWFYDRASAERIAKRIGDIEAQYQPYTAINNARDLVNFLQGLRAKGDVVSKLILEHSKYDLLTDISQAKEGIERLEKSLTSAPWADVSEKFKVGSKATGVIVNVKEFGVFVELEEGVVGLIHRSKLPSTFATMGEFSTEEKIEVEILAIDPIRKRIDMCCSRAA